jgi:hypothetical protein
LQSAGDARIEIEEALNEPAPDETSAPTSRSSRAVFVWAALALLFFAVALASTSAD